MTAPEEPIARLRTLRSIALRTPEAKQAAEFYTGAWGLEQVESDNGVSWLRGTGEEHHILEVRAAEGNAIGKIAFSVGSRREVDEAARRLTRAGIPLTEVVTLHLPTIVLFDVHCIFAAAEKLGV